MKRLLTFVRPLGALSSAKKGLLAIGIVLFIAVAIEGVHLHSKVDIASEVRRVLNTDISAGSTRGQIESYLDTAHISYMFAAGSHYQDHKSSLIALAKGASNGHLLPSDTDEVQIRFRFDDSQHLIDYVVRTGTDRYRWR
jgi:hypothetical protein